MNINIDLKEILDRSIANLKVKQESGIGMDNEPITYSIYYDMKNSQWTGIKEWAIKNNAMLEIEEQMDKILANEK